MLLFSFFSKKGATLFEGEKKLQNRQKQEAGQAKSGTSLNISSKARRAGLQAGDP